MKDLKPIRIHPALRRLNEILNSENPNGVAELSGLISRGMECCEDTPQGRSMQLLGKAILASLKASENPRD